MGIVDGCHALYGNGGDGLPESHEQVRAFAVLDDILRELAEIEIEGDEVVDLADFASGEFPPDFLVTLPPGDDLTPDFSGQSVFAGRGFVPRLAPLDQIGLGGVQARSNFRRGSFLVRTVTDGGVDVAVGIFEEQIPDGRAFGIFKGHLALGAGGIEQEWQDGVLADVFGDVLLRVIRPHLFLVDVFLEDVAEHVGIDFVVGAERAFVQVPLVLVEVNRRRARTLCPQSEWSLP